MATTDSDDPTTVIDLRSRLIAAAHGSDGDSYGGNPLVEETQRHLHLSITGERLPDEYNSNQVLFALLEAVGIEADPLERGTGPMRKDELQAVWDQVKPSGPWGPIGSEELEDNQSSRKHRVPSPDERRFQVLAALAVHGPATAKELNRKSDVPKSSITSELSRLYDDKLAGRTKLETFDDVNKYWVRPEGAGAVRDQEIEFEAVPHSLLHNLYGEE